MGPSTSRVTICFGAVRLTRSSIAASVVDLPLPVVPVTRMMPRLLACEVGDDVRQIQVLQLRHSERDETHDDGDRTPLPESVHPETAHPRDRVGEVRLPFLFELPDVLLRGDLLQYLLGVHRTKDLAILQVTEQTVYPDRRRRPYLQM